MTPEHPKPHQTHDEIDLFELISDLWAEKWVIVACTVIAAAAAVAYALLSTPVYDASARVMPPSQSDVVGYNVGRLTLASLVGKGGSNETLPPEYKPADVYAVFLRELRSQQTRNLFFEEHYLPYLGINTDAETLERDARDQLQRRFAEVLVVNQPNARERPEDYQVRVELQDPELAAEWANSYVALAASRAERQMLDNVEHDLRSRATVTMQRAQTLLDTARQEREDRVSRLREALQIARALGLENTQVSAGRTNADSELAALVEGDLMYLRGTKALQAELDVLQARTNDAPFIEDYRAMQTRAQVLANVHVDADSVAVFTLDNAAEVPETPIKPKKRMIVALGVVVGGLLGGMVALIRIAVRSRKGNQ